MKALLIIDMQNGSFTPSTPRYDAEGVIQKINALSAQFRRNGDKVIYIQHNGTKEHSFIPGTHNWQLLSSLVVKPNDVILSKTANDAFYRTELADMLKSHNITELFVTGCATDFCVNATILCALMHEYRIVVFKDCHTTADRPHLPAEKVIEHHNWIWENMTPINNAIKVVSSLDWLAADSLNVHHS